MPYDLIDSVIEAKKAKWEETRREVLTQVKALLTELAPRYNLYQTYIFGSAVKPGKFRPDSDVDIACFDLHNEDFFALMAEISLKLGRDVDLYQIEAMDAYLRAKVEQEGMLWKRPN